MGTEGYYKETHAAEMVRGTHFADCAALAALSDPSAPEGVVDYWQRRGTIMPGLWPLGYYTEIHDDAGNVTGYAGKDGPFGEGIVGSYGDKSANYGADEFRRQFAAARSVAREYVWIYCHGSVFWRMSPEEHARYRGSPTDLLPLEPNLAQYERVLRERLDFDDPAFCSVARAMRTGEYGNTGWGAPERWWVLKPFPIPSGSSAAEMLRSGTPPSSEEVASSHWEAAPVPASRYVNLGGLAGAG